MRTVVKLKWIAVARIKFEFIHYEIAVLQPNIEIVADRKAQTGEPLLREIG